jgi:hypothetical protein
MIAGRGDRGAFDLEGSIRNGYKEKRVAALV